MKRPRNEQDAHTEQLTKGRKQAEGTEGNQASSDAINLTHGDTGGAAEKKRAKWSTPEGQKFQPGQGGERALFLSLEAADLHDAKLIFLDFLLPQRSAHLVQASSRKRARSDRTVYRLQALSAESEMLSRTWLARVQPAERASTPMQLSDTLHLHLKRP